MTTSTRPAARPQAAVAARLSPAVAASLARLAGKADAPAAEPGARTDRQGEGDVGPPSGSIKAAE